MLSYLADANVDFVGAGVAFDADWHVLVPFFCLFFHYGSELGAPGTRVKN